MPESANKDKKYFKTSFIVITFLLIGPFALPLVWFNPNYSRLTKMSVTIIVVAIAIVLSVLLAQSINTLNTYYQQLNQLQVN